MTTEIVQAYVHGVHDLLRSDDKDSPTLRSWWSELGPGEVLVVLDAEHAERYATEAAFLELYEWL